MAACGSCGTELWKGAAGGLCPKCFLREGLAEPAEAIAVEAEARGSEADASAPPSLGEIDAAEHRKRSSGAEARV